MIIALNVYPKMHWWPLIQNCVGKSCRLSLVPTGDQTIIMISTNINGERPET